MAAQRQVAESPPPSIRATLVAEPAVDAQGSSGPSGLIRSLLRIPLYYKLVIANGAIAFAAILTCASLVASAVRADPTVAPASIIWPIVLAAFIVGVAVNAVVVRLALTPLRNLTTAAEHVRDGADTARAEESALADAAAQRLVRTFNNMLDSVSEYRRRLREIAIRAIDAGEAERLRISRELHDGVAQTLAAVLIQLRVARKANGADRETLLTDAAEQLTATINELRAIAQGLRPPALDMIGLSAAILAHTRNVADTTGLRIDVRVEGVDGVLSSEAELALYRLVQEAVSNVVRHSHADHARVTVTREQDSVCAVVADNGAGFDVNSAFAAGALGLFGMHERAAYAGGRVSVISSEGAGTTVRIEMPFKETQHV